MLLKYIFTHLVVICFSKLLIVQLVCYFMYIHMFMFMFCLCLGVFVDSCFGFGFYSKLLVNLFDVWVSLNSFNRF